MIPQTSLTTQGLDLSVARSRFKTFNESAAAGAPVIEKETVSSYKVPDSDFVCYGGAKKMWNAVLAGSPEVMLHGPAETGKSIACLQVLNYLCWKYPKLQAAIVRKVRADMPSSVLQTFEKKVIHMEESKTEDGITKYGGENPEFYHYPNGSRIWVAGMDRPGKVLSSEKDIIYFNQAEEAEINDWETCSTRTTGRAGVLQPGRLLGDCNPGPSTHWAIGRAGAGSLVMIRSYHQDNPTLFDPQTGEITVQGQRTMDNLNKLTGVRKKRLLEGKWVAAEGVVYETWDPLVHTNIPCPFADIIYYIASIDWGLTNPGVMQVWGIDGDGRMYRVQEIYQTGKLVAASNPEDAWWILRAKELMVKYDAREAHGRGPFIKTFVADPSRNDHILAFQSAGIPCEGGYNPVDLGIQNVQSRLIVQKDGYPRLCLLSGSRGERDFTLEERHAPTCLEEEVEVYAYGKDQIGKDKKENPVEKDNHACDAMRYAAAYIDGLGKNEFLFGRAD